MDSDKSRIDTVTKAFFSAFCNKYGPAPLDNLAACCIDEIVIIKNTQGNSEIYNFTTFVEPRKEVLTNGTLVDFEEYGISETTVIETHIAQRFSRYEKKGVLNGKPFFGKGTKLFQFIWKEGSWKIAAVVWEDDK
ncbi:DUF4440 domain-containing protein [Chitinophaga sp. Cy-1792]|uniref:DUF4440 domain-containing protein n=1 Tax=Chitinophaga sp. Cy-1792 TaxID=2608339 RepID=UPI00142494D4|nr:DUF4440 domain-containing protein [Chitinophaga sp. Cy-1792]NIG55374.1 DUF4440 domain-containing protein [Chitinophaga sp. Cy-1792]